MFLYPNADFKGVSKISIEFLQKNNIKALILDVDNTLIDYYKKLPEENIKWVQNMKDNGIKLYILSNSNKKEKVENVAKVLDLPYAFFAKKPFKKGFLKAKEALKEEAENIGVVGDQIFTDVIRRE